MVKVKPTLYLSLDALLRAHLADTVDYERDLVFTENSVVLQDLRSAAARVLDMQTLLSDPNVSSAQFFSMVWLYTGLADFVLPILLRMAVDGRYAFGTTYGELRSFLAKNGHDMPPCLADEDAISATVFNSAAVDVTYDIR